MANLGGDEPERNQSGAALKNLIPDNIKKMSKTLGLALFTGELQTSKNADIAKVFRRHLQIDQLT